MNASSLTRRLHALLADDGRSERERAQLIRLMRLFIELPSPPDVLGTFGSYDQLKDSFLAGVESDDGEELEERFLHLYAHLHMHEAPYTSRERCRVRETGGYWSHAGGLSPILKAVEWLQPGSVSADFGAGNGLQCLLMYRLAPHRRTVQIEISSTMIRIGRDLQRWLGIPDNAVEWITADVLDCSPADIDGLDFVYLYRPVRPEGEGRRFYERFAAGVEQIARQVVIFSVADCLRPFLGDRSQVFYGDGHLTCYRTAVPVRDV